MSTEKAARKPWTGWRLPALLATAALALSGSECQSYDRIGAGGKLRIDGLLSEVVGLELEFYFGLERRPQHDPIPLYERLEEPLFADGDLLRSPPPDGDMLRQRLFEPPVGSN